MAVTVLLGGDVAEGVVDRAEAPPTAIIPSAAQAVDWVLTAPLPPTAKPPLSCWCLRR